MSTIWQGTLRKTFWTGLLLVASCSSVGAETPGLLDPMQCWWRTSTGAVRIGETFSVFLTCSVLASDSVKVIPDQTQLDPRTIQMAPFDVMGGNQNTDIVTDQHRFFQYEYKLRVINEAVIGKDVRLPDIKIVYRIQSKIGQGESSEGRENIYGLPPISVRVLSLVPADATDIREASPETFARIDNSSLHANIFRIFGATAFAFSGLALVGALVQLRNHYYQKTPEIQGIFPKSAILEGLRSELTRIQEERTASGWTPQLIGRGLAVFRITGCYLLGRPILQVKVEGSAPKVEPGRLLLAARRRSVLVSGSVTTNDVLNAISSATSDRSGPQRIATLKLLSAGLEQFSRVHYGRDQSLESLHLDSSLAGVMELIAELKAENTWLRRNVKTFGSRTVDLGRRVWSH